MKITQQRKRKLAKKHSQLKASWNKVFTITQSYEEGWEERSGVTIDGECFGFLTNFFLSQLSVCIEAIRTYKGPAKFGICNKAWGFFEDEGVSFPLGDGYFGLYTQGETTLDNFWKHFDKIDKRAYDLRAKVRKLTSRKAPIYPTTSLCKAEALKIAETLNQQLPEKWRKLFEFRPVGALNSSVDDDSNALHPSLLHKQNYQSHQEKNLLKAYEKVYVDACMYGKEIIGKFQ